MTATFEHDLEKDLALAWSGLRPDEQRTWRGLVTSMSLLFAALDRRMQADAGMPHAYFLILGALAESPSQALRMSELALATHSSQSRLSHAVARLEEAGWIRRTRCESDRRGAFATLTAQGRGALAAAVPRHVRAIRELLLDGLTADQVASLGETCETVVRRLAPVACPEAAEGD